MSEEIRNQLKIHQLKGYTLLVTNTYIIIVHGEYEAKFSINDEIFKLYFYTQRQQYCATIIFSIYTIDIEKIISSIVKWITLKDCKAKYCFGPIIRKIIADEITK